MSKTHRNIHIRLLGIALLALCAATPALAQKNTSDKVIARDWSWMEKASRAGAAEVQASQLAAAKASSAKVRDYAQQLANDHAKANEELMAIASSKGITLPAEPDAAHKKTFAKLQGINGSPFDRLYMAQAGLQDHKDAVKLFKTGANDLKDPEIKAFAQKMLPTIEAHYKMARELELQ